jgi:hypothetical protein
MEHLGIDLGSRHTHFEHVEETGQVRRRGSVKTGYDPARASTVRVRAQTPEQIASLRSAVLDGTAIDAVAPTH